MTKSPKLTASVEEVWGPAARSAAPVVVKFGPEVIATLTPEEYVPESGEVPNWEAEHARIAAETVAPYLRRLFALLLDTEEV